MGYSPRMVLGTKDTTLRGRASNRQPRLHPRLVFQRPITFLEQCPNSVPVIALVNQPNLKVSLSPPTGNPLLAVVVIVRGDAGNWGQIAC